MARRRVDVRAILADPDLRRKLMVNALQAKQAREGIETTKEQAERAYYVVTEGERSTFFALDPFKGGKGKPDRRHAAFVETLREEAERVRFDVARRDFGAIDGSPLAFRRVGLVAHIFREAPALDPARATVRQGLATSEDERWVRRWWEVPSQEIGQDERWAPFAKGGSFSRFYSDVALVLFWENNGRALKDWVIEKEGSETKRIYSQDWYFREGLTWPLRTQRGFNIRRMPAGCIFGHKGPGAFPHSPAELLFVLALIASAPAEYLLRGMMSFGSWEVGVIKRLPVPDATTAQKQALSDLARTIHDAKASWDDGNETSTRFDVPWPLRADLAPPTATLPDRLGALARHEAAEEARIQRLYAELNDEVYKLYGIPDKTRAIIEETLGDRPPEVIWPQMEGKSKAQKRMEHVCRLLSHAVRRVVAADDDGIVPFTAVGGERSLLDRVLRELHVLFPDRDPSQVEVEITNELKRKVKGYRTVGSIAEWLDNALFEYHVGLYKKRPILWHLASTQGTGPFAFGVLVDYHRFDKNQMAKLRGGYLRDAVESFRREAGLADNEGRTDDRVEWQARVEEVQAFDRALQRIQEGRVEGAEEGPQDYRILTPWKAAAARPRGWEPDLDDGVKVNIEPFEKADVLRVAGVT